jgi:gp178
MNKQELIKKYKRLEGVWDAPGAETARQIFLQDLEQLDEPEKVKVPQFVADWYEENKDVFEANLYRCAYNIPSAFDSAKLNEFERWFLTAGTKPFQTLVNMHQFGYEVEKEKRYLVKVKNVNEYGCYLNKGLLSKEYFLESKAEICGCRTKHTRKQLEDDDFGWVFDCEGIEIEEVEE